MCLIVFFGVLSVISVFWYMKCIFSKDSKIIIISLIFSVLDDFRHISRILVCVLWCECLTGYHFEAF